MWPERVGVLEAGRECRPVGVQGQTAEIGMEQTDWQVRAGQWRLNSPD